MMAKAEKGLFLVQLPTGTGKSYSIKEAFREYASDVKGTRKIIYLTSLKKNIAADEFRDTFGGQGNYENQVLYIRSNMEEVLEKLPDMEIPSKYRTPQYEALMKLIRAYDFAIEQKERKGKVFITQDYINMLENDLRKAEHDFRRGIAKALDREFAGKSGRGKKKELKKIKLDAIHTRKDLKWIGELYPAVFTDEYKILLMSVSKFMKKNSTLVEPSYDFLSSDLIKDAVIFIDEFDETKDTVLQCLVEPALAIGEEYLSLFLDVERGISKEKMSSQMRQACEMAGKKEYEKLLEKSAHILEEHMAGLSFKLDSRSVTKTQNFLFKDVTYHSFSMDGRHYIRAEADTAENRVKIYLESRDEYNKRVREFYEKLEKIGYKEKKPKLISVYGMLRDIDMFFMQFNTFLFKWAESYAEAVNRSRGPSDIMMTINNARSSILRTMTDSRTGQDLIVGHIPVKRSEHEKEDIIPDLSFYNKGFQLFDLVDDDEHNESTYLRLFKLGDTPEKILAYLARNAAVFGVSATAELPSVIGNYDLDYLKDVLGPDFHTTPAWLVEKYRETLSQKWEPYEDGRITVEAEVVSVELPEEGLSGRLRGFYSKESSVRKAAALIRDVVENSGDDDTDYNEARYCNIAYAMRRFAASSLKSMLHLEMSYPDDRKWAMDRQVIEELYSIAKRDCGAGENSSSLFIFHDDYDKAKKDLLERLSAGEKIYVMSSYKTIGAGQNLQYKVPDTDGLIDIYPEGKERDRRNEEKDFDALYLGNVTNSTVNLNSGEPLTITDVVMKFVQLEELLEHAEMDRKSVYPLMKKTLNRYSAGRDDRKEYIPDRTYSTESVRLLANRTVIQAVGRMCRAHWKSPHIHIFIDGNLACRLLPSELDRHIMSPELRAVREAIDRDWTIPLERMQFEIINRAENIAFKSLQIIRAKLAQGWDDETMSFWGLLRDLVMRLPTASQEEWENNILIRNLYITAGDERSTYQYIQVSDYSTVVINLFKTVSQFQKENAEILGNGGFLMDMSDAAAHLDTVLKYPGMKAFFENSGFASSFEKNLYMMSPVIFNNIYKGALGEYAGRFIMENELGIELRPITDPSKFEFFDFELSPDVYVDFKNWKFSYQVEREQVYEQIRKKLDEIGGKKVYVINITNERDAEPVRTVSGRIIEVCGLIDENGNVLKKVMEYLAREALE